MIDRLFEPLRMNGLDLRNRIAMPAMHMGMAGGFEVTV